MFVYLPSCKFTAAHPEISKKLKAYFAGKPDFRVAGCCKPEQKKLEAGDTVIALCQSCEAITRENAPQVRVVSLWEYVLGDPDFPWPDFGGEPITVQDCWRARNNPALLDAVRACVKRMRFEPVEIAENREKTEFDGVWRFQQFTSAQMQVAPGFFGEVVEKYATPLPEEEQLRRMREWVGQYRTDRVVVYCNACLRGVRMGGANGVHLAALLAEKL